MTTAAERLVQLAGRTGTAAALLLAIGTGATAGEALVNYSGLPSGTAAQHLLAERAVISQPPSSGALRPLWRRFSDAEATFLTPRVTVGANPFYGSGGAVVALPVSGTYAGIGIWGIELEANGFAEFDSTGCHSGVNVTASGNAFVDITYSSGAKLGANSLFSFGDATVTAKCNNGFVSDSCRIVGALGVKNPTDEELLGVVVSLLTRRR